MLVDLVDIGFSTDLGIALDVNRTCAAGGHEQIATDVGISSGFYCDHFGT